MNSVKDLSILSYKELQALAVQYRIPGNIKKHSLVEILHAYNCDNKAEATRLLTDLKKNRKKRTKRVKVLKEDNGMLSVTLGNKPSHHLEQQDHYLFPMQQQQQQTYPFQWVGAEEEVGTSKYDDIKCNLSYNDIRQIVFYTAQDVYGSCDTNNNSTLIDEIIDLRTDATVSNYQTPLETSHTNGLIQQQEIIQQPTSDSASKKMSLLLKKMLQAPVGANLEEIASPVTSWSVDGCLIREQSPDNSETMTAKSDINENDEIWQDTVMAETTDFPCIVKNDQNYDNSYYRQSNNADSYYRTPLDNTVETNSLGYDQQHTYQFNFAPETDAQENCRSWLASNTLDALPSPGDYGSSRLPTATSIQYESPENLDLLNPSPDVSSNVVQANAQYCFNSDQLYANETTNLLESSEIVPDLNFDTSRFYQTSSNVIRSQEPEDYYRQICPDATSSFSNDFYNSNPRPQLQQQQTSQHSRYSDYTQQLATASAITPIYHVELESTSYDSGYYQEQQQQQLLPLPLPSQQQPSSVTNQPDPLQQVHDQQYESYAPLAMQTTDSTLAPNNPPPPYGSAPLDQYWPRWSLTDLSNVMSKTGGRALENTLNLCTPNYVDYSKLNETCCVYSNKTPVMTLRKGFNSVPTALETTRNANGGAEFRQHNFVSNWLLYNEEANANLNTNKRIYAQTTTSSTISASFGEIYVMGDSQAETIM